MGGRGRSGWDLRKAKYRGDEGWRSAREASPPFSSITDLWVPEELGGDAR